MGVKGISTGPSCWMEDRGVGRRQRRAPACIAGCRPRLMQRAALRPHPWPCHPHLGWRRRRLLGLGLAKAKQGGGLLLRAAARAAAAGRRRRWQQPRAAAVLQLRWYRRRSSVDSQSAGCKRGHGWRGCRAERGEVCEGPRAAQTDRWAKRRTVEPNAAAIAEPSRWAPPPPRQRPQRRAGAVRRGGGWPPIAAGVHESQSLCNLIVTSIHEVTSATYRRPTKTRRLGRGRVKKLDSSGVGAAASGLPAVE